MKTLHQITRFHLTSREKQIMQAFVYSFPNVRFRIRPATLGNSRIWFTLAGPISWTALSNTLEEDWMNMPYDHNTHVEPYIDPS